MTLQQPASGTSSLGEILESKPVNHSNYHCYNCLQEITGVRFHCAVCESVDNCRNCELAGLPDTEEGHSSSHITIKIPYPSDPAAVASASRRARVLWSERDAAMIDATTERLTLRSRSNSIDSSCAATAIATEQPKNDGPTDMSDHLTKCNGCNEKIVGARYQCANCSSAPSAYNLCHECEKTSFTLHPLPHVFIKFNRRVDRPIRTKQPLVPILYTKAADRTFADESERLSELLHESTYCDHCMTPIRGSWYPCVYCGEDLCDTHEMTHNADHCCLVFKSKVDLIALSTITDINNPNNTTALFHPVYLK